MLGNAKIKVQLMEVGGRKAKKIKEGEGRLRLLIFSFYHMNNQDTVHS